MPGLVAGVDEAGRGPLAGPVVAAAVILDDLKRIRGLNDSKLLTPAVRERLYDEIRAKALCCSVAEASVEEIDRLNILQATLLAMRRAIDGLRLKPIKVLIDGNQLPVVTMLAEAIVDGDAKVKSISAASILAKVHRDRLCLQLDALHPHYGFAAHKGYATPEHLAALRASFIMLPRAKRATLRPALFEKFWMISALPISIRRGWSLRGTPSAGPRG